MTDKVVMLGDLDTKSSPEKLSQPYVLKAR